MSSIEVRNFCDIEADLLSQTSFHHEVDMQSVDCNYYDSDTFNQIPADGPTFSLFHANSRSLNKNLESFLDFLSTLDHDFSVIGFSETWLGNNRSPLVQIEDYIFVENHRTLRKGVGVGLFASNKLSFVKRDDIIESVFIEIKASNGKNYNSPILVGVIYRPPHGQVQCFNDHLSELLSKISNDNLQSYIMGDFNFDLLKSSSSDFLQLLYSNNFLPTITRPTHVTNQSVSLIYNILTNTTCDSNYRTGVFITDISDHFPIFLRTHPCQDNEESGFYARNYSESNVNYFMSTMHNIEWNVINEIVHVNDAYNTFFSIFGNHYEKSFPMSYVRPRRSRKKRHPWISAGILQSIKRKNKLYKKYLRDASDDGTHFRIYRNKLNHVIRIAKKNYFSSKFNSCKNDLKRTWEVINNVLHKSKKDKFLYPTSFYHGYGEITDKKTIADAFNDFFVNVGPTLASSIKSNANASKYLKGSNPSTMYLAPTDENEVVKISLSCLQPNKAAGFDGIKPGIVKKVIPLISQPLTYIINRSLETGIVPDHIKVAKVVPIFKKGDPMRCDNYRPISIPSCFSKIFERLVHNRLYNFFTKSNVLYNGQYGFRPNHSTELALAHAILKPLEYSPRSKQKINRNFFRLVKGF